MDQSRLHRLYDAIEKSGLTGIVLNAGPSLTYLTGLHFHLMERPVVLVVACGQSPILVLPELEKPQLEFLPFEVNSYGYGDDPRSWPGVFHDALAGCGLDNARLGVEPQQLRLLELHCLQGAVQAEYVDGSEVLAHLRARKDDNELACIKRAVTIAENALEATLPMMRIGVTEKAIAGELFVQLIRHGSDPALPFFPIVAAGPNSTNPHATPSGRPLASGDLLIIDWGAGYHGYMSDLTRTFAVGAIDARAREIHETVQRANAAGRKTGAAGDACAEVDRAARWVIEDAGYGGCFTHRTGHGLGMECHEHPYIHGQNDEPLAAGNVYTVEPGIYFDGIYGVRIEDDVVMTATGPQSLSTMSRNIRIVG
ncbi:MAG: M24 family metallopeptidase [Desulfopila sp.]